MPNSSIKNDRLYQDLRKQGDSKEKAARISNAAAAEGRSAVGRTGRQVPVLHRMDGAGAEETGQTARYVGVFESDQRQANFHTP